MTLFDAIGKTYNKTRVADDRIVSELLRLADLAKGHHIIADIGAGTGNYSIALANAGLQIRPGQGQLQEMVVANDPLAHRGSAPQTPPRRGQAPAAG